MKTLTLMNVLILSIIYRIINVYVVQTFFSPDEYWQNEEVAYSLVYSDAYRTWEWLEHAQIRSFIQPLLTATVFWCAKMTSLDYPILIAYASKLIQCVLCVVGDVYFYKLACNLAPKRVAAESDEADTNVVLSSLPALSLFFFWSCWFNPYCLIRPFANSLETVLCVLVCAHWPQYCHGATFSLAHVLSTHTHTSYYTLLRLPVAKALLFGALCVCVRPTSALTLAVMGMWLLVDVYTACLNQHTTSLHTPVVESVPSAGAGISPSTKHDDDVNHIRLRSGPIPSVSTPSPVTSSRTHTHSLRPIVTLLTHLIVPIVASVLAITAIIDKACYGAWSFPIWSFLRLNLLNNVAVLYGVSPWHWLVTNALPTVTGPYVVILTVTFFALGVKVVCMCVRSADDRINATRRIPSPPLSFLVPLCVPLLTTCLSPHQEYRFILPALPHMCVWMAWLTLTVTSQSPSPHPHYLSWMRVSRRRVVYVLLCMLVTQCGMFTYFATTHQRAPVDVAVVLRREVSDYSADCDGRYMSVWMLVNCHNTLFHASVHTHRSLPAQCLPPTLTQLDCAPLFEGGRLVCMTATDTTHLQSAQTDTRCETGRNLLSESGRLQANSTRFVFEEAVWPYLHRQGHQYHCDLACMLAHNDIVTFVFNSLGIPLPVSRHLEAGWLQQLMRGSSYADRQDFYQHVYPYKHILNRYNTHPHHTAQYKLDKERRILSSSMVGHEIAVPTHVVTFNTIADSSNFGQSQLTSQLLTWMGYSMKHRLFHSHTEDETHMLIYVLNQKDDKFV